MARFDRKIERNKTEFQFSKTVVPQKKKMDFFKENFSFQWINMNIKAIIYIMIAFMAVSLIIIPLLSQLCNQELAFILAHTFVTSMLVVLAFYFINKEKINPYAIFIRYIFIAMLLFVITILSVNIIT